MPFADRRCPFDGAELQAQFVYGAPPAGEVRFDRGAGQPYAREILSCGVCGHFVSVHRMDLSALYAGDYVDATYGTGADGLATAFERINHLPAEDSDNIGRVRAVTAFAAGRGAARPRTLLDVGSGLCVFGYRMKAEGWTVTALDPDARAAAHATGVAGVRGVCGDFMTAEGLGRFDAVTFNKVLEHVVDPVAMLARAKAFLADGGFVHLEVPDGEAAAREGSGREEFFIDHWHVFSPASLALMARQAGFNLQRLERLREPSTKFTLRTFLTVTA